MTKKLYVPEHVARSLANKKEPENAKSNKKLPLVEELLESQRRVKMKMDPSNLESSVIERLPPANWL